MHFVTAATSALAVPVAVAIPLDRRATTSLTFQGKAIKQLLAFGDSYTYVDGKYGHLAYSFIGDAFNYQYTPEQLLTNTITLNSTSAGGPNWVEYLTGCFSGRPADCSVQLWDFAFAGSDITPEYLTLHHNFTVDLVDQVKYWNTYAKDVINLPRDNTLVAFWIGINDVNDSGKWTNVTFEDFYNMEIAKLFDTVQVVYDAGYRNFLFMNVPPARAPTATSHPNVTQIALWNELLEHQRHGFNRDHKDAITYKYDDNRYLTKLLKNPTKYGFADNSTYCANSTQPDIIWNYAAYGCRPIDTYFWFNSGHLTYPVHKLMAEDLRNDMA